MSGTSAADWLQERFHSMASTFKAFLLGYDSVCSIHRVNSMLQAGKQALFNRSLDLRFGNEHSDLAKNCTDATIMSYSDPELWYTGAIASSKDSEPSVQWQCVFPSTVNNAHVI